MPGLYKTRRFKKQRQRTVMPGGVRFEENVVKLMDWIFAIIFFFQFNLNFQSKKFYD
jgi:hypothetical protein